MTISMSMPNGAVLVAMDIAKNRNEVLIEEPGKTRRRRMTVLDARADHDRLVDVLGRYGCDVVAGFEGQGIALTAITTGPSRTVCSALVSTCVWSRRSPSQGPARR